MDILEYAHHAVVTGEIPSPVDEYLYNLPANRAYVRTDEWAEQGDGFWKCGLGCLPVINRLAAGGSHEQPAKPAPVKGVLDSTLDAR